MMLRNTPPSTLPAAAKNLQLVLPGGFPALHAAAAAAVQPSATAALARCFKETWHLHHKREAQQTGRHAGRAAMAAAGGQNTGGLAAKQPCRCRRAQLELPPAAATSGRRNDWAPPPS